MQITKNTQIELDYVSKNLTNKKYYTRVTGSKRRSHKSVSERVAVRRCHKLQSYIDNGLIKLHCLNKKEI